MVKENKIKKTLIGLVPEEWEDGFFGDYIDGFTSGMTPYRGNKSYYKGNIPWITSGELNYNVIKDTNEKISEEAVSDTNLKLIPSGTFLMAITGLEAAGTRGACAITGIEATTNQSCMALYPKRNILVTPYLYHFYVRYGDGLALRYCQGTKQQSYNAVTAKKLPIAFPKSVTEQQAIAEALSDADAWIASLEDLIAKKRLIKQGAMHELLTPKEGWEVKKLGDVGEVKMCKRVFQFQTSEFGDIPFFKIGTFGKTPDAFITRTIFEDLKSKFSFPKKGDILISAAGTIGRAVVYDGNESYFQDSNIVWIDNNEETITNDLLKYVLETVQYNTEGGTIQRLYNNILKSTSFHCPPLKEQSRIAEILNDMSNEIGGLEQKLTKARQLKRGMMQELLTGRVRLV